MIGTLFVKRLWNTERDYDMKNAKKTFIRNASIYLAFSMILAIVLGIIPEIQIYAASTKVGKPDISASANDSIITLRIGKTKNAEGFRIYAKEPNAQKYEKLETITQDGKKERTYSYTANESGEYAFKVRGYNKSTGIAEKRACHLEQCVNNLASDLTNR